MNALRSDLWSDEFTQLREILRTFTYRPGWTFEIKGPSLIIEATVVDTDNYNRMTPLSFYQGIPTLVRDDFPWKRWLLDTILEVERHEACEFFKIDGVKVFDPHKEDLRG